MSFIDIRDNSSSQHHFTSFALGAVGGLAAGLLVYRSRQTGVGIRDQIREGARGAVRRLRPGRLHRLAVDQEKLDRLEGEVLEAFLADDILCERGVDIGAVSPGVIELSGSVWTEREARHAVEVANRVHGVKTVINRMRLDDGSDDGHLLDEMDREGRSSTFIHSEGRVGGMGRRRQSWDTDPMRPDDSQEHRQDALAAADRTQWSREGLAHVNPRLDATPEIQAAYRADFERDEMDNQDPSKRQAAADRSDSDELSIDEGPVNDRDY